MANPMQVSIAEAEAQLTDLVRRAEAGDEVVLTRHGRPAVRLVPMRPECRAEPGRPLRGGRTAVMTAVDTSALMAILLNEATADACAAVIEAGDHLLISAVTLAEALIVAAGRAVGDDMRRLVDGLGFEVVAVTPDTAERIALIHARWGKGRHPAALNFGDCFAYDVARQHGCPLLYVGDDFSRTDLTPAR